MWLLPSVGAGSILTIGLNPLLGLRLLTSADPLWTSVIVPLLGGAALPSTGTLALLLSRKLVHGKELDAVVSRNAEQIRALLDAHERELEACEARAAKAEAAMVEATHYLMYTVTPTMSRAADVSDRMLTTLGSVTNAPKPG